MTDRVVARLMADVDPGMAGVLAIVEALGGSLATAIRLSREVMPVLAETAQPLTQLLKVNAETEAGQIAVSSRLNDQGAGLLRDLEAARKHLAAAELVLRPLAGLPALPPADPSAP